MKKLILVLLIGMFAVTAFGVVDRWKSAGHKIVDPAIYAYAVTPHDTNEVSINTRGVYVGGAGDLVVILKGDTVAVTFAAVPAGLVLPIQAKVIKATGTTATNIVGLE